jgi:hypothetical protein
MYIIRKVQIQYYDTYFLPEVSICLYGVDSKHYELKIMQFSDPFPRKFQLVPCAAMLNVSDLISYIFKSQNLKSSDM